MPQPIDTAMALAKPLDFTKDKDDAVLVERPPPQEDTEASKIETHAARSAQKEAHVDAKGGGVPSLDEAHAAPLERADGPATDKAAIAEASENLRNLPSKAEVDDPALKDLGFQSEHEDPHPLYKGLSNEELWKLVRRFNKQTFHLRAIPELPASGLDLSPDADVDFSADKLRAEFERLYVSVFTSGAGAFKHIARLRNWNERRRTIAFLVVYVVAWVFDVVPAVILGMLMVLVAFKPSRAFLFPPAPLALVSASHGGLQKPKAGHLGSTDSLTGATETHKGEAVEHEASQFFTGVTSVAVSAAMGKSTPDSAEDDSDDDSNEPRGALPDPTAAIGHLADVRGTADDSKPRGEADQTKVPVQTAIWASAKPVLLGIAAVSDTQERIANALSPTPPFSQMPKYRLAAIFVPLILGTLIADAHLVAKGAFAGLGFAFFGQPLMDRGLHWLNTNIPDWPKYLRIDTTLLRGVPTNAQLTIALLRIGESNKAPIPPPPKASAPPPSAPKHHEVADLAKDNPLATEEEIHAAALRDEAADAADQADAAATSKPAKSSKTVGFLKGMAAGVIGLGGGKAQVEAATIGNEHARNRLGALPSKTAKKFDGPTRFRARFHGHKGCAFVTTNAVTPSISFAKGYNSSEETKPIFTIQIEDLRELKKSSGLGWKSKLVVGAVLKRETADALDIVDAEGNTYRLTAIPRRDELFNRLASIGSHKWSMI